MPFSDEHVLELLLHDDDYDPGCPPGNGELTVPAAVDPADASQPLRAEHLAEFRASGISGEIIAKAGIRSVSADEANRMLNRDGQGEFPGDGWAIPFDDPESPPCYWRVKPDEPRKRDDHTIKYESPRGSSNRAYFPPGFDNSRGMQIVITEGEKKALCAISRGMNCMGLTGVWNWQKPRKRSDAGRAYGKRELIDDLSAINWRKRGVIICFDSDAAENHSVELAQQRLAEMLKNLGANVKIARLPAGPEGQKLGLDDAIMTLGLEKTQEILEAAEEAEIPDFSWPELARLMIDEEYRYADSATLRYWNDAFWKWNGSSYEEVGTETVRNAAYRFLEKVNCNPNKSRASELVTALEAEVEIDPRRHPPAWLRYADYLRNYTPLAFAGSIAAADFSRISIPQTLPTIPATPDLFVHGARRFDYDPKADSFDWQGFLATSIPDHEAVELLQEWFGYVVSGRMDYQKFLVLVGAPRSGKSIITNTLSQIVGESATATTTLKALGEDFGLSPLLGKQLLLIPDAADRGACIGAVERIKAITGCDGLDINRKHKSILNNVRLQTRIVITCNQLPRFLDVSGALHDRMLIIHFPESFAGREDHTLPTKIKSELPGIFNWALDGWSYLSSIQSFIEPSSSRDVLREAEEVFSPMKAFLDEYCEVAADCEIPSNTLWMKYKKWCEDTGHQPGTITKLGTDLRAAAPEIKRVQRRANGGRERSYRGLRFIK